MSTWPEESQCETLASFLVVFGNAIRLKMFCQLQRGRKTVTELAEVVAALPDPADAGRRRRAEPKREIREIPDGPAAAAEDTAPGAQIRVAADLMDKLVNYAGEVSIYRSRLEQQVGLVRHTLKDVDSTIQRLKEQLRKMDMESEAQMMSRYQKASSKNTTEFDPLELDRFSNMQELSRALAESGRSKKAAASVCSATRPRLRNTTSSARRRA